MKKGKQCAHQMSYFANLKEDAKFRQILSEEYGEEVANTFTFERTQAEFKLRHEYGENPTAQEYAEISSAALPYMSAECAEQYKQDAEEFRIKFENGEVDAPYLTKEHLDAESNAIQTAIATNKNVLTSSQEKTVIDNTKTQTEQPQVYVVETVQNPSQKQQNLSQTIETKEQTKKSDNSTEAVTPARLKSELKTKSVKEVLQSYSNSVLEVVHTVLHNDKELKGRIDEIMPHLEGMSGKNIGNLAYGCNTPVISKLITEFPEKSDDILNIVAPAMCFSGRKLAEQKVERQNCNEAV